MKKILLTFIYNYSDDIEYEDIVSNFSNRNYDIHCFNGIELNNFPIDRLPDIIKELKDQYEDEISFSVISNIREVITIWYRVYNQLVDKFICLIDDIELTFSNTESEGLFKNLALFNSIENEFHDTSRRIYLNIKGSNYKKIISFLSRNSNYKYFDDLINIDYDDIQPVSFEFYKSYILDNYQYCFPVWDIQSKHEIRIDKRVTLENEKISSIAKSPYYIFILSIFNLEERDFSKVKVLIKTVNKILNSEQKLYFEKKLKEYIIDKNNNFPDRLGIASLLASIKSKDSLGLVFEMLKEDYEHINLHYGMLYNILCYITNNLFEYNANYLEDMSIELDKIMTYYLNHMSLEYKKEYNEDGDIVIITDQLLNLGHSPSKLVLDFCKEFSKLYPDKTIYLFVEDSLKIRQDEISLLTVFMSAESIYSQETHREYLKGHNNVRIIYSNCSNYKFQRTREFVYKIIDINPKIILSYSNISITSRILYDYYPTVYYTMGSIYQIAKCDVFVAYEKMRDFGFYNKDITCFLKPAFKSYSKTDNISRESRGFKDEDFIMVTVGNRLEGEISDEYFLLISNFLKKHEKAKWIIIGGFNLRDRFEKFKLDNEVTKQIVNIKYESKLQDFYSVCDIYINPDRLGGGISIAMAMDEGLPIVNYTKFSAGMSWVGQKNCCGTSDREYIEEIRRLYYDNKYRKIRAQLMKMQILECKLEEQVKRINELFTAATQKYNSRRK
ncbi:glycosyltransferase [Wukongibacter baidiensis]|uniref:glycosyltransferase n=1 Tax=Wukongibacter baidiensis TaxID=1723361 RepID=UPI003D7F6948